MGRIFLVTVLFAWSTSAFGGEASVWDVTESENENGSMPIIWDLRFQTGLHGAGKDPETGFPNYEEEGNEAGHWAVEDFLMPRSDSLYPWFLVEFGLEAEFFSHAGMRLVLSTGEIHVEDGQWLTSRRSSKSDGRTETGTRTVGDEFYGTGFVREAVLTGRLGPVQVEAGKRIGDVLGGLVYGDYGLGVVANLDFRDLNLGPWSLSVAADLVGEEWSDYGTPNPLLSMRLAWEYDFFESIVFEAAYFDDRSGTLGDVFASLISESVLMNPGLVSQPGRTGRGAPRIDSQEWLQGFITDHMQYPFVTSGQIGYVGLSGNHFVGDVSVHYRFALEQGTMNLETPAAVHGFQLEGYAGDLNVHYSITPELGMSGFFVALSGHGNSRKSRGSDEETVLPAFIAPAPYWVWSRMFFTGGLSQGVFASRATAAGINAHGVAAAGMKFDWSAPGFEVNGAVLWLEAMSSLQGESVDGEPTHYGLETNLEGRFLIWDGERIDVFANAEIDFLFPGNFFPENDVAYRMIGLLDVVLRD